MTTWEEILVAEEKPLGRTDSATRVILASGRSLFRAFVDREMLASWRAPDGMHARIERFDPRIGGGYRIVLTYADGGAAQSGKASASEDIAEVRFLELDETRIVEEIRFASEDPRLSLPMTLTTSFEPLADGTKVTMAATGVPDAIDAEAHRTGIAQALRNLARLTE
jgi:uncharacterized protein YndB with AHSA1/START domain